jgi:CRISPR/Cas system-associated exonuclease Cas4 (RecB family)
MEDIVKSYQNQLLFYAYLVNKYISHKKVTSYLIFLEYPDYPQELFYTDENFLEFENVLKSVIPKIKEIDQSGIQLTKNFSHCQFCEFFRNGKCLMT